MPPNTTSLRLRGTPPDASVYIDDQLVGQLRFVVEHGVALPPGLHRITVQAPGYFPYDKEVQARGPEHVGDRTPLLQLDVALVPIPD